jgi:CRISPR-associated protein Cas1
MDHEPIDLIIPNYTKLSLDSERLVVSSLRGDSSPQKYPLLFLRSLHIPDRSVSLSSDLLAKLSSLGVSLTIHDFSHAPLAHFDFFLQGSWRSIQAQAAASQDPHRCSQLAAAILLAKLHTQRRLLRYLNPSARDPDLHQLAIQDISSSITSIHSLLSQHKPTPEHDLRPSLLGHEGFAARSYWRALSHSLPLDPSSPPFTRQTRGATDPINASLNYGYAILTSRITAMTHRAGLHPAGGLLHQPHGAKPALVLDLLEPYRPLVDDAAFGIWRRRRSPSPPSFDDDLRKHLVQAILDRLAAPARPDHLQRIFPVDASIQRSIRLLATHLRDPLKHPAWNPWRWDVRGPKHKR